MGAENNGASQIQTRQRRECPFCGREGAILYPNLKDYLFGAPGEWSLRSCGDSQCSLVWLDPIPVESDIARIYQNYHTHDLGAVPSSLGHRLYYSVRDGYLRTRMGYSQGVGRQWYRHLAVLAHLHPFGANHVKESAMFLTSPREEKRLLDVGCGNGFLLARMRALGWIVEGTEIDKVALQVSRSQGLTVHQGDLFEQSYPDGSFDAVHVSHVIEHVPDPVGLVQESRRVLKDDGVLIIRTPNVDSLGHQHFITDWRGLEPPRHLHLFNGCSISNMLRRAGFDADRISIKTRATGIISMSNAIRDARLHPGSSGLLRKLRLAIKNLFWVFRERMLLLTAPDVGEEIVVIAKK